MPFKKKASDEQIISAYSELSSVWKVAKKFGMCGQSVHERLVKLGVEMNNKKFTEYEISRIKEVYESGIKCGDGKIKALSDEIKRPITSISKIAGELHLSNRNRKCSDELRGEMSVSSKEWLRNNEHPKGMLGKKHNDATKAALRISSTLMMESMSEEKKSNRVMKILKKKEANGTLYRQRTKTTWKAGWRNIGGVDKYYRSRWEANYARYLEFLKLSGEIESWEHEPETFWFEGIMRGVRSYLPDFKVIEKGKITYHEVKGWMDSKSKTKIKRMKKYHPEVVMVVIDKKPYLEIERKMGNIINGWEFAK